MSLNIFLIFFFYHINMQKPFINHECIKTKGKLDPACGAQFADCRGRPYCHWEKSHWIRGWSWEHFCGHLVVKAPLLASHSYGKCTPCTSCQRPMGWGLEADTVRSCSFSWLWTIGSTYLPGFKASVVLDLWTPGPCIMPQIPLTMSPLCCATIVYDFVFIKKRYLYALLAY